MKNYNKVKDISIRLGLCAFLCGSAHAVEEVKKIYIQEVILTSQGDLTTVTFELSEPIEPTSMIELSDPYRLLIELDDKDVYYDQEFLEIKKGVIRDIRMELKDSSLRSKKVEYIAIDMNESFSFIPSIKKNIWQFACKPRYGFKPDTKPIKMIQGSLDIAEAISIARANSLAVQIAREKVDLSKLRKWEALRALFPALQAKYEQTRGDIKNADRTSETLYGFEEKFLTFQLTQPLYQGGKLRATYEQARLNLAVTELEYNKILQEVEFEARRAFMTVVQHQINTDLYRQLLRDVQEDVKTSIRLYRKKLNTRVEHLNVLSKVKQSEYQLMSSEKDLEIAHFELLRILNLDMQELPHVIPVKGHADLDITLEKLLRQMRLHLPEMQIAELELKLAEQGRRIGHSDKNFKIELSGSMGRSASHYDTEDLTWKDDFSGGIRISKAYGGNTVGASYLYDDTSAKLGQSSRTLSKTGSASLSILDNIKSLSEAKESDIAFQQASQKLVDERRSARIEVKKNYYNYQKSLIQMEGLIEEVKMNEEELVIVKAKKNLKQAELSDVVSAKMQLVKTRSSLNEALMYYHISLAGINKSIGLSSYYKVAQ